MNYERLDAATFGRQAMSNDAPDPATPTPADTPESIPRTGSGAGTALMAMLKKRQMRASAEPQPPQDNPPKPGHK